MKSDPNPEPEFDAFAENYDEALQKGLDLTGESKEYFAAERVRRMKTLLNQKGIAYEKILDFGCGTGGSISYLLESFSPKIVVGTDVSADSLSIAQANYAKEPCQFEELAKFQPNQDIDLAFCNGVFHHIPLAERASCVKTIFDALRPGGHFCFWENNPWNPGTRWVMKRVPFDRDAIMLWPGESRSNLKAADFEIITSLYCFFFPGFLSALRPLENYLSRVPLGGQYMVLARKPIDPS